MHRMAKLGREILLLMAAEHGTDTILQRLADPFWFQALGCTLGFDWHSSGVTTTVCGALKQGLADVQDEIGLYVCGGKGGRSRRTPDEVRTHCDSCGSDAEPLVFASRMSAKIDSAALQDGFQLYHHTFFFTAAGQWCVVQQGMPDERDPLAARLPPFARRYHWLGSRVHEWDCEPHNAICCEQRGQLTLDLVAERSGQARETSAELARQSPIRTLTELRKLPSLEMAARHKILVEDIHPERLEKTLLAAYDRQPAGFTELLGTERVGPKTIRALALVAELVYGHAPSFSDPARFSFAHGGKDGVPYPVNRTRYDQTIDTLHNLVDASKIDLSEKRRAFRRLVRLHQETGAA